MALSRHAIAFVFVPFTAALGQVSPLAWSADSREILFASNRDRTGRDLYRMRVDGTGVTRVTTTK